MKRYSLLLIFASIGTYAMALIVSLLRDEPGWMMLSAVVIALWAIYWKIDEALESILRQLAETEAWRKWTNDTKP